MTASAHGGVAAVVRARLERHVERRAARPLARRLERDDLGVRPARALVPALPHDLAVRERRPRRRPGSGAPFRGPRSASSSARSRVLTDERRTSPRYAARDVVARRRPRSPRRAGRRPPRARRRRSRPSTPPSTWTSTSSGSRLAQLADAVERLRHERLARVAGMDAHAEHDVGALARPRRPPRPRVSGLNATPTPSPCSRACAIGRAGSSTTSTWNVTLSPPASAICGMCRSGLSTMRWQSSTPPRVVHERRDRLEHDRADRDRLDEVPVADVEVEDPHAGVEAARLDLLAEAGEVGRVERRLDLAARPRASSCQDLMRRILRDEEAGRAVDVRQREQKLGPPRVAEAGPFGAEIVGLEAARRRRPPRSRRALIVQTEYVDRAPGPHALGGGGEQRAAGAPAAARARQRRSGRDASTPSPEHGASTSARSKPRELGSGARARRRARP